MRILPPLRASSRDVPFGLVSVKVMSAVKSTSLFVPSASTNTAPVLIAGTALRSTSPPANAFTCTSAPKAMLPLSVAILARFNWLPAPSASRRESVLKTFPPSNVVRPGKEKVAPVFAMSLAISAAVAPFAENAPVFTVRVRPAPTVRAPLIAPPPVPMVRLPPERTRSSSQARLRTDGVPVPMVIVRTVAPPTLIVTSSSGPGGLGAQLPPSSQFPSASGLQLILSPSDNVGQVSPTTRIANDTMTVRHARDRMSHSFLRRSRGKRLRRPHVNDSLSEP